MLLRYLSVRITEQAAAVPVAWRPSQKVCRSSRDRGKKMQ